MHELMKNETKQNKMKEEATINRPRKTRLIEILQLNRYAMCIELVSIEICQAIFYFSMAGNKYRIWFQLKFERRR